MILREPPAGAKCQLQFFRLPGLCLLLFAVTLAVYWPVMQADFLYLDDPFYFAANSHVQSGLKSSSLGWAFTTGYLSNWHPLTWLSLMLDVELFGPGPFGPHLTNLLFHAANTVLMFLWLRGLTAATWRSMIVAALFALHPLHVESVAWISERKDVLSTFFGLLSLMAYTRYVTRDTRSAITTLRRSRQETRTEATVAAPGWSRATGYGSHWYWLAWLFFALGLMSKPMLVTLPLVMLLLDWWPLNRMAGAPVPAAERSSFRHLLWEKVPFFVLSAVSCVVTFMAQQKGGAVTTLASISFSVRVANAFISYSRYLGKTFWPVAIANPYPHPMHWPLWPVLFAAALFVALSGVTVWGGRKFPFVLVGWLWFVGMLIPVIGLVQVGDQAMADRYTYLPLTGVFIILVWGIGELWTRWRWAGPGAGILAVVILITCAWRTRVQTGYWQNSGTLFRHAKAVTENNYVACNNLGVWLSRHDQVAEAVDCFRESLRIKTDNPDALFNLGNTLAQLGRWDEALDHYHRALQINPDQADVLSNLGLALATKKHYEEAVASFEQALKVDPDCFSAQNNLATVLFIEHRYDEAARHFREAIRLLPDHPQLYSNLGDALAKQGQTAEAVKCYQAALRLNPDAPQIKAKLRALGVATPD